MSNKSTITAIIIAKNEEEMIVNCVETVRWCDEILVIDNNSTDKTVQLAEASGARVVGTKASSFSELRNEGLKKAKTDWVFYLDADERVTPKLAQEIQVHVETNDAAVLQVKRKNIYYGQLVTHGGWGRDLLERVFLRSALKTWQGQVHESPEFTGQVIKLHQELVHFTHRNTRDNLLKSADWTLIEAKLLYEAKSPQVKISTLFRKAIMEFVRRLIFKKGYQDGIVGWIESMVQGMNKFLVYLQLWELQQKPSLSDQYQQAEREIVELWKQQS